jgi:hypothetical protein
MKTLSFLLTACLTVAACSTASAEEFNSSSSSSAVDKRKIVEVGTATAQPGIEELRAVRVKNQRKPRNPKVGPPCSDQVVNWIWQAGFRGQEVRVSWAIAQRESNGNPRESTWPDLGLMQLNAPTWQKTKYWPANIYDPIQNLQAVKNMVRDFGWQPWGLRVRNGQVSYDFSSYGMWSSWQKQNWIVIPFERYYAQFPKKCARNL